MTLEQLFEALSDRTRLRLLNLLSRGEICVCFFTAILKAPQPTISRHLAYLRRVELVDARRDGKWMHYSLRQPEDGALRRILESVLTELGSDADMQKDAAALQRACCAVRLPPELADAPKPVLV